MEPGALIDRLQEAPDSAAARRRLQEHARTPGLSKAYFERIARLLGSDPTEARSLADRWKVIAEMGDEPALAYRAKGVAERLRGQWSQSVLSFREAGRRASTEKDRLAWQVGAVDSMARTGDIEGAVKLGRRLASGLLRLGETGLAGRVRLNVAAAFLWADRYLDAQRWLQKAEGELEAAELPFEAAGARLSLSTCELHMGRPSEALALARRAAMEFDRLEQPHMSALAESNVAQAQLQLGRADEALDLLLSLRNRYEPGSAEAVRVEEYLGDAYLRLNMPEEARSAYSSALALPMSKRLEVNRANCRLGLAWAHLQLDEPGPARASAAAAARSYARFGNPVWERVAQVAEAEALLLQGRPEDALEMARLSAADLRRARAEFARAEALLAQCSACQRLGREFAPLLRDAGRLIRRRGMLALEWRVHALRATGASPGRRLPHYRRMAQAIAAARAGIVSTVAKANYLRDKDEALGLYLEELLRKPTSARVREAIAAIQATRSAALLDEIVSAVPATDLPISSEELEDLRRQIGEDAGGDSPGAPVRRRSHGSGSALAVRLWIEKTRSLQRIGQPDRPEEALAQNAVVAVTPRKAYLLKEGRAATMPEPARLADLLRRVRFELFAPQADRDADPEPALRLMRELREELFPAWTGVRVLRLAPSGDYWKVPWSAVSAMGEPPVEAVLALGPSLGRGAGDACLPADPQVVILGGPRGDLPQIEAEIDAVRSVFTDAQVLSRADEIRRFLQGGQADLLHVACHAGSDGRRPMFSFLEFEDGRVFATEIARSVLRAELVTLSACDTGNLSLLNRQEPDGLVRAFLARGVRAALASSWSLDDEAGADFAKRYTFELKLGRNVLDSASHARASVRTSRAHPYFWAPMTLFGGYRFP
jgi:predicted negative regulator of RcsB-dependent stress response